MLLKMGSLGRRRLRRRIVAALRIRRTGLLLLALRDLLLLSGRRLRLRIARGARTRTVEDLLQFFPIQTRVACGRDAVLVGDDVALRRSLRRLFFVKQEVQAPVLTLVADISANTDHHASP